MTSRKTHSLVLFLALSAVAALLLLGQESAHGRTDRSRESGAGPWEAPAPVAAAPEATRGPRPGRRYHYDFEHRMHLETRADKAITAGGRTVNLPPVTVGLTARGRLTLRFRAADAGGWQIGFRLDEIAWDWSGPRNDRPDNLASAGGEAICRLDARGRLSNIRLPDGVSPAAARFWVELLARLQVERPDGDLPVSWEVTGVDMTGEYRGLVRRISPAGEKPVRLERCKLAYDSLRGANPDLPVRCQVSGTTRIVLADVPVSIEGREEIHLTAPAAGIDTRATLSFRLTCTAVSAGGADSGASPEQGSADLATLADNEPKIQANGDAVAQAAVENLAKLAASDPETGEGRDARTRLGFQLVGLIRTHPDAVKPILLHMLGNPGDAPLLLGALAAAGSVEAQLAIVDVLQAPRWSTPVRAQAILAVSSIEEPIAALDAVLIGLHKRGDRLSRGALLALGAVGGAAGPDDKARATRIGEYVLDQAARDGNHALTAFGNVGAAEVPAVVAEALANDDEEVRMAGLRALTRVRDTDADRRLVEALRSDESELVRLQALEVLGLREHFGLALPETYGGSIVDFVKSVAERDESETIRDAARRLATIR